MKKKFRIAPAGVINNKFTFTGDKETVSEDLFWKTLKAKVREITEKEPEKYDEVLDRVINHLQNDDLTILDTWFGIK